jgi:sec-independent protein translocase protein TatA
MFDPSAPHIIILLIVVLLLFGSRRLPGAAKSLGESMHIFKKSVHGETQDDAQKSAAAQPATVQQPVVQQSALPPVAPQPTQQQQLADLQRQVADMQRQNTGTDGAAVNGTGAPLSEAQRGQQPF